VITALVIEDDEGFREALMDECRGLGHDVVGVGNQQQAEAALASRSFDYVLLDLGIPVRPGGAARPRAGVTLLGQLRESGITTPVIVITAQGDDHTLCRELLAERQAQDFIKKTFEGWGHPTPQEAIKRVLGARAIGAVPTPAAPSTVYATAHRLHLDGEPHGSGHLVLLDDHELEVTSQPFELLVELGAHLRRGDQWVGLKGKHNYHKQVQRLREALEQHKGVDGKQLVEGGGRAGFYRLSTPPANVTASEKVDTYFKSLLVRLGGWPGGLVEASP
jgi:DNA-binding response OmpR family regulator